MKVINEIIKSGKFPPIIFLFGKEEFLVEEAYRKLIAALVQNDSDRFNFDAFDCNDKETTADKIAAACNSLPMMGNRRITAINHFDSMFSLSTGKKADLEKNPLVNYIENPSTNSVVIIRAGFLKSFKDLEKALKRSEATTKKKLAGAKLPYNFLFTKHTWVEFPEIYSNQMPNWISARFRTLGYSADVNAANVLATQVDSNLRVISNTIDRIITHNPEKKTISSDDVNYLIGQSRNYNVFELEKAIGRKNIGEAINILTNMLKSANEEIMIISRLTTFFSTLWKLAEESKKGLAGPKLAGAIGVHPAFINDYTAASRMYSPAQISKAFLLLTDADTKLKTTQTDRFYLMQDLITNIMS